MLKVSNIVALSLALVCLPWTAHAQDKYPSKPIMIVVPFAAGGSTDMFARVVAKNLQDSLKQTVIVENRPGAGGNTGAASVAKAAPDGYTLVLTSTSLSTGAAVGAKPVIDPVKAFAPVALVAKAPFILAVNDKFPAKTPQEFIAVLKREPGKHSYASAGPGSTNHFATEMIKAMSGASIVHVPYRGAAPAMTDLSSDQVQMTLSTGPSLTQYAKAGRIRTIGITSAQPSPVAPDLPPMATAIPGFEFEQWWGILAPAGTPAEIIERLNAEVNRIVATREVSDMMLREGAVAQSSTSARFGEVIASEISHFQKIAKQQNIRME